MRTNLPYLETLGSCRLSESGRVLRISRAREKALLGFLAVNAGRSFPRVYLANLLWPGVSSENAKHSLNNAVYTINRSIPSLLSVTSSVITIPTSRIRTDIDELTTSVNEGILLRRLNLIRGEFLADLELKNAEEFEMWRSDYNRQLFFNIEASIKGELPHLNEAGRKKVRLDLAALAIVSPSLESVCAELLRGNEQREVGGRGEETPPPSEFRLPFVGREAQMTALRRYWAEGAQGTPKFVNIVGRPGHGKTRLIDEFIETMQRRDVKILRARSYRSERRIALGPVAEMLSEGLNSEDLSGIEPIWLAAIHDVVPALPINLAGAPQLSPIASQSRFYEAVLRVIGAAAERRPVLIFIDDVQWLDESTQALLSFLSHRLAGPVMIAVAERKSAPDEAHRPPWRSWPTIEVEELSPKHLEDALDQLPNALLSSAPQVRDLDRLTRGHPYMVTELIRSSATTAKTHDIPAVQSAIEIDEFLGSLLNELSPDAQHVASALSVIGRPTSVSLLSRVSKAADVTAGLNVLLENGLVDHRGGRAALRHDLVRESTYKRLPPFTRTELHRRVAAALATNPKRAGETAEHYYRGRDRGKTHVFAVRAAEEADSRHASEESIYFLRMAIKAARTEQIELQLRLGDRLYNTNRTPEATRQVNHILTMADSLSIKQQLTWRVRALELAYASGAVTGHHLRAELDRIRQTVPPNEIAFLVQSLYLGIQSAIHDGNRAYAAHASYMLKAIADAGDSIDRMRALPPAVRGHSLVTSASEADRWAEPLMANLQTIQDPELTINVMAALVLTRYAVGQLTEATLFAERILREISRVGAMSHWPVNASNAQMLYVEQGRFAEATALFDELKSRATGYLETLASAGANASFMHYMKGDFVQARDVAVWAQTHLENRRMTWLDLILRGQIGLASLELGDLAIATTHADSLRSQIDELGTRIVDLSFVEILIARVALLRGQRQKAVNRLQDAVHDYADRDFCCRMRMQLELARILKQESRNDSRSLAKSIYEKARASNAIVIAEGADSLLARL